MKILIYRLILWWLNRRLGEAEESFDSMGVDRMVIATEAIQGAINAAR